MRGKRKRKAGGEYRRKHQGMITVFVVLIMVPTVVITGIMVDVSRLKLFQTQAAMAADSYGEVVLSEFDNLLKELYGLFAVTQNEEGKKAIQDLAKYTNASFHPKEKGLNISGSMLFDSAITSLDYTLIPESNLANENVFLTQISDFMQFRVIEQMLTKGDTLAALEEFKEIEGNSEAVSAVADIGDRSADTLASIGKFYHELSKIKEYENYLQILEGKGMTYENTLKNIVESDKYADYINYLKNQEAIDAAKAAVDSAKNEEGETGTESNTGLETETESGTGNENASENEELAKQWVDVEAYKKELKESVWQVEVMASVTTSDPVDFAKLPAIVGQLTVHGEDAEKRIEELLEKKKSLDAKLDNCSDSVREGIQEETEELEKIVSLRGRFRELFKMENEENVPNNESNQKKYDELLDYLGEMFERILAGEVEPKDTEWLRFVNFSWKDVPVGAGSLYDDLKAMYGADGSGSANKKAADEKIDNAKEVEKEAIDSINEEESTQARDIPEAVMSELQAIEPTGEIPGVKDYLANGIQLSDFSDMGTAAFDKFLLTEYDFGMFSSRVTGIAKEEEAVPPGTGDSTENSTGKIPEYSLTKVKMSGDVNYLYGAEVEYLYGGKASSKQNLAAARNTICGVRMVMNTISTYSIKEINSAINQIARSAAAAVAATGIGAAAAPLVRIAVSTALRMAVGGLETAADWKSLKNREEVLFFKKKIGDLESLSAIKGLLGQEFAMQEESKGLKLDYEGYLHILLFVMIDKGTLVKRTSDLVTLNVNQSGNSAEELSAPLAFRMDRAYTAVNSTCRGKLEMVVVPDYMLQMFVSDQSTRAKIESIDDGYVSYSVIRGY